MILRAMYKGHSETTYKMLNDPHSDEKLVIEQEDFFYLKSWKENYLYTQYRAQMTSPSSPLQYLQIQMFLSVDFVKYQMVNGSV